MSVPVHMSGYVCGGQPHANLKCNPSGTTLRQDLSLAPPPPELIGQARANNPHLAVSVEAGGIELRLTRLHSKPFINGAVSQA